MKMKAIAFLTVLIISVISFTGCACKEPEEPKVVIKYKYLELNIPKLQAKPEFVKYDIKAVNLNGEDYYFMRRVDGNIMLNNWNSYKNWAETNYDTLKGIEESKIRRGKKDGK